MSATVDKRTDGEPPQRPRGTYEPAGIISKLYCLYVFPFLYQNYRRDFDLRSIEENADSHQCAPLAARLNKHWQHQVVRSRSGQSASLLRALFGTFGWTYTLMNVLNFLVYGIFRMAMPLILGKIIHFSTLYQEEEVGSGAKNPLNVWLWLEVTNRQCVMIYSLLLGGLVLLNILVSHPYFMLKWRLGMRIRIALSRLVYEKALRLSGASVQNITVGRIVNHLSTDAAKFDVVFIYSEFMYLALPETAVAMTLMYFYIGRASFGALAIVLLYIPFQGIMANVLSRFRASSIVLTDDRLRLMAEILPAMRVIKMYVWEKSFSQLVHLARKLEIGKIKQAMFLRSINLALFFISSKVMSFVCIIFFLLDGGQLNAEVVFVSLALINQIRDIMTYQFPTGISYGVETYISLKRIEKFLLELELDESPESQVPPSLSETSSEVTSGQCRIALNGVSVNSPLDGSPILKDISFEVTPGKLTTIIGPVGSGKSSVLLAILKELPHAKGTMQVNGKLIYASQEAWIFSGTVRENILFGRPFESTRYREVLQVAALSADLKQFPDGDQTLVDDRGTSLSGGQRARISLARALYTDADCYLLDDPLSAVDSSVAKHIFEKCIKEYLRHKVVLLVTHQLQFIKQAEQIVILKEGTCLAHGSHRELLSQGIDLYRYTAPSDAELAAREHSPQGSTSSRRTSSLRLRLNSFAGRLSRASSHIESDIESTFDEASLFEIEPSLPQEKRAPLQVLEGSAIGGKSPKKSSLRICWLYIRAGAGLLLFSVFLASNVITQIIFTGTDYWLSAWTDYQEKAFIHENNGNYTFDRNPVIASEEHVNILIYSGIVFALFLFSIVRTVSYFVICMNASVNLHNRIFSSLIQAPILFFEKTLIGVIMNRVSRDLGIIDDLLPSTGFEALEILGNSLGIFILCTALNYFIVFPFVVLLIVIYLAQRFYVDTARQLKRLEGMARSPLFSQLASTLNGLTTIRSFGSQDMFLERFSATQDRHTATFFTFISASRIYGIFLELICVAYIYCLIAALNIQLDDYSGSVIGLTISQSLLLCNSFNWGVRQYTEVETYFTSVERIAEFGRLQTEPLEECIQEPHESWPARGEIVFEDVSLAYEGAPDEPPQVVLRSLTFTISGGEKIGIVGRTGAGKSSLITTLFRLTQPSGSIRIDGADSGDVSLARLRRSLSIIPQEPILFSGNIRRNLDPFGEKADEELWDALEKVQLKGKVLSLAAKLDSPVSECGSDFSVGQKQLICLARAILRKNRIIVCDEATANVDPRTDSLIQNTMRTEFANCTVLTIAHRLNTIIDYDRVMVLDAGQLAQFDSPYELIQAETGIFYELFSNLNADTQVELKRIAESAHARRQLPQG